MSIKKERQKSVRLLGLDLSGAKNHKTCLSVMDYFPRENKCFLAEFIDGIGNDAHLIEVLKQYKTERLQICAVNAALTLPPLLLKNTSTKNESSLWVEKALKKAEKDERSSTPKIKTYTPYTQRPVELWLRYEVLPKIPQPLQFEIDETLGGNRAPLTARMFYLKNFLNDFKLIEILPKLSLTLIAKDLKIPNRFLLNYRSIENGVDARIELLERITEKLDVFIYAKDQKKLIENLSAFDSFICAYTAYIYKRGITEKPPRQFPYKSGWIYYPQTSQE